MLSAEQNDRLTRVGPGTPMGDLLRYYWHPVQTSQGLMDNPVRPVRILGEDLTLFRTGDGSLGLVGRRCAHRGVDLRHGIPQESGLRCPYHGWMYDTAGQCVEMPPEKPTDSFLSKIKLPSYPVIERAGLVWAYLGPDPAPEFPGWEIFVKENVFRQIASTALPCNWLQSQENAMDTVHAEYLHGHFAEYVLKRRGEDDKTAWAMAERMKKHHIDTRFERHEYGFQKYRLKVDEDPEGSSGWQVGHPLVFPNSVLISVPGRMELQIRVPIDDENSWHITYQAFIPVDGVTLPEQQLIPAYDHPVQGQYPLDVVGQDVLVWTSQGAILDRTQEHLATSDKGVVMFRRLLVEQLTAVEKGEDPINVFRNPETAKVITLPHEPPTPVRPGQESMAMDSYGRPTPVIEMFPALLGQAGT